MDWLERFDEEGFRAIHQGLSNPALDWIMLVLSYSGLGQVQFLASLGFLLSPKTKYYVLPLLLTILVAGLPVAQLLKALVPRDRPSNLAYAKPFEDFHFSSFPSGHTTTSFAVATMLFLITRQSKNSWMGWTALIWASLVGVSRIYRGVHWPTDVLAGLFAGVFSACLVYWVLHLMGKQLHFDEPELIP